MIKTFLKHSVVNALVKREILKAIVENQGGLTAADVAFATMVASNVRLDSGGVVPEPGNSFDTMRVTDAQIWALYKVFGDTAAVTDLVIRSVTKVHADSRLSDRCCSSEHDQSLVGHRRAFGFSITAFTAGRVFLRHCIDH